MITIDQAIKLRELIADYRDAEIADSWKGGGDPADIPGIEADLREAKTALEVFIHTITEDAP